MDMDLAFSRLDDDWRNNNRVSVGFHPRKAQILDPIWPGLQQAA